MVTLLWRFARTGIGTRWGQPAPADYGSRTGLNLLN